MASLQQLSNNPNNLFPNSQDSVAGQSSLAKPLPQHTSPSICLCPDFPLRGSTFVAVLQSALCMGPVLWDLYQYHFKQLDLFYVWHMFNNLFYGFVFLFTCWYFIVLVGAPSFIPTAWCLKQPYYEDITWDKAPLDTNKMQGTNKMHA